MSEDTGMSSEDTVNRFFAALEAGDIDTVREIYSPDAVVWHNDDLIEQPVEENLKTLAGLHRVVSGLHYDITRRVAVPDGVLEQHVLRGRLPDGSDVELHCAMYLQVRDGHVTRIEEYLDSGKRAPIKAAREALASS
ncbi:MAG: nuclear transport factor 2 family protein [Streptosporangiaceae bacterium]|jgi:ketosteroid isomerase-like protein